MSEKTVDKRKRLVVFRADEAEALGPEIMPMEGMDDSVLSSLATLAEAGVEEGLGERTRMVFREPGDGGMSLVHAWFKSGYVLPFHSHDADCLYYVIGGELRMGSHVLRKGDGFFIPKDQAYGYEAGPEGVEVLEFRNVTRFNFVFGTNDEHRWAQIAESYRDRGEIWANETTPPSERGQ